MHKKIKLIAMYFPQLHAIPENDEWWGKGFTDWNNVKKAKPQFEGHYQPRIPLNNNYYDQSKLETLRWQIDLAKKHGVYGFCHYHYWFDGKQLLETPTNLILENKDIDFPFCLSWANETWSRRWDAQEHQILIKQTHPPTKEGWKKHYDYLIKAWKDPRAIKVDGKPVFVIYRPARIEKIDEMLAYWKELALADGLQGLYFIFQKQSEPPKRDCLKSFDATFQFQPFEAIYTSPFKFTETDTDTDTVITYSWFYRFFRIWWFINVFNKLRRLLSDVLLLNKMRWLLSAMLLKFVQLFSERIEVHMRTIRSKYFQGLTIRNYDDVWKLIVAIRHDRTLITYPGAFIDWDNTARYKNRATLFSGASPYAFEKWFSKLVDTMPLRNLPENFIFLNAWNEWSEGTYLEPDEIFGYQYIEAVKKVLDSDNDR
jgi:Glycosyltransferase WbsX